jgi:hypothetical protein
MKVPPAPNRDNQEDLVDISTVSRPIVQYHEAKKYLLMMKFADAFRDSNTYTTGKLRTGATCVGHQRPCKYDNVLAYPKIEYFVQECYGVVGYKDASEHPVCNKPERRPESERFLEKPGFLYRNKLNSHQKY